MANTFKNAATGSTTTLTRLYTCPSGTTAVIHAMYLSNIDGTNNATVDVAISGSANFQTRRYILKTVEVPADSTAIIEKPINLEATDVLKAQASANSVLQAFASILEIVST